MITDMTLPKARVTIREAAYEMRPTGCCGRVRLEIRDGVVSASSTRRGHVVATGPVVEMAGDERAGYELVLANGDEWSVKIGCGCGG